MISRRLSLKIIFEKNNLEATCTEFPSRTKLPTLLKNGVKTIFCSNSLGRRPPFPSNIQRNCNHYHIPKDRLVLKSIIKI